MRETAKTPPSATDQVLDQMLEIIRSQPGIRPSELNRRMNLRQSDAQRASLIRRGLVRKLKDGQATRLYAL